VQLELVVSKGRELERRSSFVGGDDDEIGALGGVLQSLGGGNINGGAVSERLDLFVAVVGRGNGSCSSSSE